MTQLWGTLWGISVGPGDPEWLTLKGLRILQSVPVVAMPQNRQGDPGMAYGIIAAYVQPHQTVLPLALPFVTDPQILQQAWQQAGQTLLPILTAGKDVAFVSEGDVSFYSTFTYIAAAVHAQAPQIPIQVIPGVCSPLAAAAALRIPLAIGDEKVAILPALYQVDELKQALDWAEVVILMKVASVFQSVWHLLADQGLLQQARLVQWVGGQEEELFSSLEGLADYRPPYFSVLIVRHRPYGF